MGARGERIGGRYVLGNSLGAGRGGRVFESVEIKTGRRVALKLRDPSTGVDLDIERAGLRSIEHPHLLRVLDAGVHEGRPFVVTELAEYGSLAGRARPLSTNDLSLLVTQLLDGLAFLHAQGILHGDVKTENILVTAVDPPIFKLADFGLAQRSVDVAAGTTLGSPAFMPPEIIRGDPADERSDLYSLGVTLYEAAFGELPFDDEDVRTLLMRHLTEVPRRLQVPGGTDPRLFALLRRLLAKEPAERPVDARAALALWRGDQAAAPRWIPPRLGVLIGRDQELAELEAALEGDQAVVSIEGPPGIGKTRLLNEFALRAELRGTPTYWWTPDGMTGVESQGESSAAFDPLEISGGSAAREFALSHASSVFDVIRNQRYVVFIDDVDDCPDWFQEAVSLFLREAASTDRRGRLVCVSGRSRAASLVVNALEAGGFSPGTSIHLPVWSLEQIQEGATALLGARRLAADLLGILASACGGVPAELEALCQALAHQGLLRLTQSGFVTIASGVPTETIVVPVDERTARLLKRCTSSELRALRVLMLLRTPPTPRLLEAVASVSPQDIRSLQRAGLATVLPGSNRLRLVHERLKRAIRAQLDPQEERALYDGIADGLERDPELAPLDEVLLHRCLGSDFTKAMAAVNALRTQSRLHSDLLRSACESVLALWPDNNDQQMRASLELSLLDTLLCMGDYPEIQRLVGDLRLEERFAAQQEALVCRLASALVETGESSRAISALDTLEDGVLGEQAQFLRARALFMQRKHAEALDICKLLPLSDDKVEFSVSILELQASCKRALGDVAEAESLMDRALAIQADSLPPRRLSSLLANRGLVHFYQGRMTEAEDCFQRSLALSQSAGDRYGMARTLNSLAATAGEMGHYVESAERLRVALDLCRRLGETETASSILGNLGQLLMLQGSYPEALARAREGTKLAQVRNLRSIYLQNVILLGGILATVGLEDDCHKELDSVLEECRGSVQEGQILLLWSGLALERGILDPTSAWLARARWLFQTASVEDELLLHDLLMSRLLHRSGDPELAFELARACVKTASRLKLPSVEVESLTWLSELTLEQSFETSRSSASEALAISRRVGLREGLWRAGRMLGRVEAYEGNYRQALLYYEEALRTMYEIAASLPESMMDHYVARPDRARLFAEVRQLNQLMQSQSRS